MKLSFFGADQCVTGSCHCLEANGKKILIDCGLQQGRDEVDNGSLPFHAGEIDYVLVTHAHIDHSGRIPMLIKQGFQGRILTTRLTAQLMDIMLQDSAHIQESDAEYQNRKNLRAGRPVVEPLYTVEDALRVKEFLTTCEYGEKVDLCEGVSVECIDAGHLLGSASMKLTVTEGGEMRTIVFSGDIGNVDQPIIRDPQFFHQADFVVMESTYGNRNHTEVWSYTDELAQIIDETLGKGGNVVIPSFAVGRTQELLYFIRHIKEKGLVHGHEGFQVYVDSPLAINATRVFLKNFRDFDEESLKVFGKEGKVPNFAQVHLCETAAESRALNSSEGSAIIISASGMADAGRVLHHLKHNLWRPESTILFVGYQAEGCLGRRLIDGITRVRVLGEEIAVKAQIKSLDGFSAHADANQIMSWLGEIRDPKPAKIFIVHGESTGQEALKSRIQKELGIECYIPFRGDLAKISGRASEIIPSNIPAVSVEKEMEDVLRDFDSDYRQLRRRVMQYVVRQPKMMEPVIKVMSKARNYIRKLFTPFNI